MSASYGRCGINLSYYTVVMHGDVFIIFLLYTITFKPFWGKKESKDTF